MAYLIIKFKMVKLKVGDKVKKKTGYSFPGEIVSIFNTTKGEKRFVVEMIPTQGEDGAGMLHIFNESVLEKIKDSRPFGFAAEFNSTEQLIPDNDSVTNGYTVTLTSQRREVTEDDFYDVYNNGFSGLGFLAPDGLPLFGKHGWASGSLEWNNGSDKKLTQKSLNDAMGIGTGFVDAQGGWFPQYFDTIRVKENGEADKAFVRMGLSKKFEVIRSDFIESETAWFLEDTCSAHPVYCEDQKIGIVSMPYNLFGSTGLK